MTALRRLWCRLFGHTLKTYQRAIFNDYWETYCPRCGERAWRRS